MAGDEGNGLFGALGIYGSADSLAEHIGAPLPPDFYDPESAAWMEWVDGLSKAQRRDLRRLLWQRGRIAFFDSFAVCAALTFPWLNTLHAALRLAEVNPDQVGILASCWRAWLSITGRGHRIPPRSARRAPRARDKSGQCPCRGDGDCE